MSAVWPLTVRLADVDRGPVRLKPEVDSETRARIAEAIGVDALGVLNAEATLKTWLDGAELQARVRAVATQTCGVSLEPFEAPLEAVFTLHLLPPGSPHAPPTEGPDIAIDPEADDPPEVLESETIDLGGYLVEHLALEVDPFPRKPGAVFEQPGDREVISPFAALAVLKDRKDPH